MLDEMTKGNASKFAIIMEKIPTWVFMFQSYGKF